MVAYPNHIVFLKFTPSCRRRLINNGYSLPIFLAVSNVDGKGGSPDAPVYQSVVVADGIMQGNASPDIIPLHEYLTSTKAADRRFSHTRTRILHNAIRETFRPVVDDGKKRFPVPGTGKRFFP